MKKNPEIKDIDQLMAEADELIAHVHSEAFKDMKEEHRVRFEKRAQDLKEMRSRIQSRIDKEEKSKIGSGADGMHEAFMDIIKAMGELKNYIT